MLIASKLFFFLHFVIFKTANVNVFYLNISLSFCSERKIIHVFFPSPLVGLHCTTIFQDLGLINQFELEIWHKCKSTDWFYRLLTLDICCFLVWLWSSSDNNNNFKAVNVLFFSVFSVQQWAVSFGKEIAALSNRYSGAKLLQKVR